MPAPGCHGGDSVPTPFNSGKWAQASIQPFRLPPATTHPPISARAAQAAASSTGSCTGKQDPPPDRGGKQDSALALWSQAGDKEQIKPQQAPWGPDVTRRKLPLHPVSWV